MTKNIPELVDNTINNIKRKLIKHPNLSKPEIIKIIEECIQKSFDEVSSEDRSILYKQLSLKFHPDKLERAQPELYQYLNKTEDLTQEPQKILIAIYNKPNFKKVMESPYKNSFKTLNYVAEKMKFLESLSDRYIFPLRYPVKLVDLLVGMFNILVMIAVGISISLPFLAIFILNKIVNGFTYLITTGFYQEAVENYTNKESIFRTAEIEYLEAYRMIIKTLSSKEAKEIDIDAMDDDALKRYIIASMLDEKIEKNPLLKKNLGLEEEVKSELDQEIRDQISIIGLTKLSFVNSGLYRSITRPLPPGLFKKFGSLLARPFQLILAPLVLISCALIETTRFILVAAIFLTIGFICALHAAVLVSLNAPLLMIDFMGYIFKGLVNKFKSSSPLNHKNEQQEQQVETIRTNPLAILGGSNREESRSNSSGILYQEEGVYYSKRATSYPGPRSDLDSRVAAFNPGSQ